jgi:hypothetical protein
MNFGKKTEKTPKKIVRRNLPNLRAIWKKLRKESQESEEKNYKNMENFWDSRHKIGESPYLNLPCKLVQDCFRKIEDGRGSELDAELVAGLLIHMAECQKCEMPSGFYFSPES